ncbi:hypothetical protein ES705_15453 [subsurface metagenome]
MTYNIMKRNLYQTLRTAGIALAMFREYKRHEHKDKRVFAAALASLTAESMGGSLHTYSDEGFTLVVSEWTQSNPPKAVLLSDTISNWTAAVAFWCVSGQNRFANEESWSHLENTDIDRFIMKSTYDWWQSSPQGSALRWAEATRIYEDSGLDNLIINDSDKWKRGMDDLKPELLKVLGYDSFHQIDPSEFAKFEKLLVKMQKFDGSAERDILAAEYERDIFHSYLRTAYPPEDRDYLLLVAYNCIARPLPTHIPIEVLRNRDDLSPAQALAWYLVEEERGPKLTYAAAANMLGMKNRQEIGTHLKRVRETLSKTGLKPRLSGIVRWEYLYEEAPEAIEIDLTLHHYGGSAGEGRDDINTQKLGGDINEQKKR